MSLKFSLQYVRGSRCEGSQNVRSTHNVNETQKHFKKTSINITKTHQNCAPGLTQINYLANTQKPKVKTLCEVSQRDMRTTKKIKFKNMSRQITEIVRPDNKLLNTPSPNAKAKLLSALNNFDSRGAYIILIKTMNF